MGIAARGADDDKKTVRFEKNCIFVHGDRGRNDRFAQLRTVHKGKASDFRPLAEHDMREFRAAEEGTVPELCDVGKIDFCDSRMHEGLRFNGRHAFRQNDRGQGGSCKGAGTDRFHTRRNRIGRCRTSHGIKDQGLAGRVKEDAADRCIVVSGDVHFHQFSVHDCKNLSRILNSLLGLILDQCLCDYHK